MAAFGIGRYTAAIGRRPVAAAAALISLIAGVTFVIRAPDLSDRPIFRCETASGTQTCLLTGSGSASFSGNIKTGSNIFAVGTISGATVFGKTLTGNILTIGGGKASINAEGEGTASGVILSGDSAGFSGKNLVLTASGGIVMPNSDGGGCVRIRGSTTAGITVQTIDCPTPGTY